MPAFAHRAKRTYTECQYGYNGLFDRRLGKTGYHRVPMETAERVLALYPEKYGDRNVLHFHEKLREEGRPSGGACAKIWR
jgi:hypothetical protein